MSNKKKTRRFKRPTSHSKTRKSLFNRAYTNTIKFLTSNKINKLCIQIRDFLKEKLKKKTFRSAFIETFMSKLKNIIQEKGNIFTALNDTTISQQIKAIKNLLKTTINKPQLASLDPLALQRSFVTLLRKINIDTLKSRLNSKKKTI